MAGDDFAQVRERTDLVALVQELSDARVKMRTADDVRLTPCPFCGSKSGFSVDPQSQVYCCHHAGCGAHGDAFTFAMQIRGMTRKYDALTFLAERTGVALGDQKTPCGLARAAVAERAQEVKKIASEYYANQLWARPDEEFTYTQDEAARTATVLGYQTETRGHSEGVLKYMRVGWADGGLVNHLKEHYKGCPDDERKLSILAFIASGLIRSADGCHRDTFRPGGYVYPVWSRDRVITFTAKYPDEDISDYQLPRTVDIDDEKIPVWDSDYFFLNMDSLTADDLVLVEGENDVLSAIDLGGHAAVCGMRGTPKREQLAALAQLRRGKRTFLCFDTDDAGQRITWQVCEALAGPKYDVRNVRWEARNEKT